MPSTTRLLRFFGTVGVATLALTSCVDSEAPTENGEQVSSAEQQLRLAHIYDPQHPYETCGVPAMNDALEGSGIQIDTYPSSQLGAEQEALEQVQSGSLDLAMVGVSFLGLWVEEAEVFDAPYLFRDADHLEQVMDGPVAGEIWEQFREDHGIDVLGAWYFGTRQLASNNQVIIPDDMGGQSLRVPEDSLSQTRGEILGGDPVSMAYDEVYLGLQQGTIDAVEAPVTNIYGDSIDEVQEYVNMTDHMIQPVTIVGNESVLAGMADEEQNALREAVKEAAGEARECMEEQEAAILEEWEESGDIEVNESVDVQAFRERALEMIPDQYPWGDLYREIQDS